MRSRFNKDIDKAVERFVASIPFDQRLYKQDIDGSIAHVRMLSRQGVIAKEEADKIISGLQSIIKEIESGVLVFGLEFEDIHMSIEKRLYEKIGDVAGKLHTARSRNDQIALDLRLYMKGAIARTIDNLKILQKSLLDIAEANIDVVMPGYTHLQQAQPVLFAHHLLAYFEMLKRDRARFEDCLKRTDVMPLGSGALAGVTYPVDRESVAAELGFSSISDNRIDAVSDRDFALEYEAAAAITMMHLSRFCEEIILWSSAEFGFIELDDAFATTSSIMPQKKNPDVIELTRGKTGRVYGSLVSLLTVMKGIPLAYNRDLQEDKEPLFDVVDVLNSCLEMFPGVITTMKINGEKMSLAADSNYNLATDMADYLTKKGMPFREAHAIVGNLVKYAVEQGKSFHEIGLEVYKQYSDLFDSDVFNVTVLTSIDSRQSHGGTASQQVKESIKRARQV
ncbi:MAG: argininosuccinate lyase [Dehalococcoidia bacterium]